MRLLDLTLSEPAANLALDEALLLAAESTGVEVLRLWESPKLAVVVGAGGSVAIDVNVATCEAHGVPILRRASGGGTVLLGPGCLCFSLVLAYDRAAGLTEIPASNRYVLNRILNALQPIAPNAVIAGTSDLAIAGLKFSGNAQQRKRTHFLHHGTLLCGFDLELITNFLHAPERQPEYRQGRGHGEFVRNLAADATTVKTLLSTEWNVEGTVDAVPWWELNELLDAKYRRDEWNRRR